MQKFTHTITTHTCNLHREKRMCVLHVRARVWVTTLISWPVGGEPRKLKFLRRLHPTPGLPTTPSQNILLMVVTLDVSKLSGWLNAHLFHALEGGRFLFLASDKM